MKKSSVRTSILTVVSMIICMFLNTNQVDAATFMGIGDLPGGDFLSSARGISADGTVVVGDSHSSSGCEAFRWTEATGIVGLGDLPGGNIFSVATAT